MCSRLIPEGTSRGPFLKIYTSTCYNAKFLLSVELVINIDLPTQYYLRKIFEQLIGTCPHQNITPGLLHQKLHLFHQGLIDLSQEKRSALYINNSLYKIVLIGSYFLWFQRQIQNIKTRRKWQATFAPYQRRQENLTTQKWVKSAGSRLGQHQGTEVADFRNRLRKKNCSLQLTSSLTDTITRRTQTTTNAVARLVTPTLDTNPVAQVVGLFKNISLIFLGNL